MTDELKPVPCGCGGEAVLCESDKYDSFDFTYMIYCKACGISSDVYDTEAEAIEAWNRAMGAKDINVPDKERKKGKWSNYKDEHCCSVCHCVVISDCWNDEIRYDYCPYCGADMESE